MEITATTMCISITQTSAIQITYPYTVNMLRQTCMASEYIF